MAGFLISFFTVILVLASLFLVFLVLLQRGSSQGGMGTAFGGGMAESAFGGDTNKVLTKATVTTAIIFFIVGLGLYLGQLSLHHKAKASTVELDAALVSAEAAAKAKSATKTEAAPKAGEATAEAMKVLAAEEAAKAPAKVEAVKAEVKTEVAPAAVPAATQAK